MTVQTFPGVYRAVVRSNEDPQSQRRLKLELQTSPGQITEWCWPLEPSSIHTAVPVIGQGVWVFFLNGDPEYPVWFGAFGTNQGSNKQYYVKPVPNSTDISNLSDYLIVNNLPDGTQELDLTDSLIAIANKAKIAGTGNGAQGTTGSQGPQGPQGAVGQQGTQGVQGEQGVQGTQGLQGFGYQQAQGVQGTTGSQGPMGSQGTTGSQGAQGVQGVQGFGYQQLQGTTGATGPQGTIGAQGAIGSQGVQGTQGGLGTQGVQGTQGTTGNTGAGGTIAYYGNFYDDSDQTATANTPTPIKFNHDYGSNGVSAQSDGTNLTRITFANTGTYNIQFSAQFHNTGGGGNGQTVQVWFKKNGTNVPQSNTYVTVNTNSPYIVASWNFVDSVTAGDYYQLMWQTDNANIILDSFTSGSNPSVPAVILTATQVAYSIQGIQGLQGSTGTQGAIGTTGTQGTLGAQGSIGSQGATGTQGATGAQGLQGLQGYTNIAFQVDAPVSTTVLWVDTDDTTSVVIPAGGTSGQVLAKNSNTNYDVIWKNDDTGMSPFMLMGG